MEQNEEKFIFIADAHLNGGATEDDFFQMLKVLSTVPRQYSAVFLGDIFELWIGISAYESPSHHRFLDWCRVEQAHRNLYFIEGNHEFFVSKKYQKLFSSPPVCASSNSASRALTQRPLLFQHGDLINRKDWKYRLLRAAIRNPFSFFLLWMTGPFFGPPLTQKIRLSLKDRNMTHKKYFPEDEVRHYYKRVRETGFCGTVFFGHFHAARTCHFSGEESNGGASADALRFEFLPAFANASECASFDPEKDEYRIDPWRILFPSLFQENNESKN